VRLEVGDGHALHVEVHGPADGVPCVVLHGGPGSGAAPWWTDFFDLRRHRVVLFDQRGCGRSTPDAGRDLAALEANTTHHLVADVERLREHLGIERWLVVGASWGSTLADPDPAVAAAAAQRWCAWEETHMGRPGDPPDPRFGDPVFRLRIARLVTHYWRHAAWLGEDELLEGTARLAATPAVLVHGRLDVSSPLETPWRLAERWPAAELVVIEDEGHRAGPAMDAAVTAAIARLTAT